MEVEAVVEHFKTNYSIYIAVIICLLPVIFFTRKYSLPLILYTIETLLYLCIMHVTMWTLVVIAKWFKEQSSMKALHDPDRAPDWQTPLVAFWQKEEYNPVWVYYAEIAFVFIVIFMVYRFRPPKVKRIPKRQSAQDRAKAARSGGGKYPGMPTGRPGR